MINVAVEPIMCPVIEAPDHSRVAGRHRFEFRGSSGGRRSTDKNKYHASQRSELNATKRGKLG